MQIARPPPGHLQRRDAFIGKGLAQPVVQAAGRPVKTLARAEHLHDAGPRLTHRQVQALQGTAFRGQPAWLKAAHVTLPADPLRARSPDDAAARPGPARGFVACGRRAGPAAVPRELSRASVDKLVGSLPAASPSD